MVRRVAEARHRRPSQWYSTHFERNCGNAFSKRIFEGKMGVVAILFWKVILTLRKRHCPKSAKNTHAPRRAHTYVGADTVVSDFKTDCYTNKRNSNLTSVKCQVKSVKSY